MKLSTLIVSYKSITKLEKCLNTIGNVGEILIVENSDNIEIKKIVESKYKNCKVIINNDNLGWSKAANIGLKEINTKYVIILNPDTLINDNQFIEIENATQTDVKFLDSFFLYEKNRD